MELGTQPLLRTGQLLPVSPAPTEVRIRMAPRALQASHALIQHRWSSVGKAHSTSRAMEYYLEKHLRRCLSKEEREALFKEHPLPDIDVCVPPKPDKYLCDYLGKRYPKDLDTKLCKVQSTVLAIMRPVVSAWQGLLEGGLDEDPEMSVPAVEVLSLCQRTLCLIGNSSEVISQERRSKILETVDPSWAKYGADNSTEAKKTLFGDDFRSALADKVEKDTALSKAVAITKKGKNRSQSTTSFPRRDRQRRNDGADKDPPPITPTVHPHTLRLEHGKEGSLTTSGREFKALFSQLESDNQRPMGSGNYTWLQTPLHISSPSIHPPFHPPFQSSDLANPSGRGTRPGGQRCNSQSSRRCYRVYQSNVPCTKVRRGLETSDQPQGPKQIRCCPPLQDGVHSDGEGPGEAGGLAPETRPEGCLPIGADPPTLQEIPPLQMAGPDLGVPGPPLRPEQCPSNLHEAHEASSLHLTPVWGKADYISGRHTSDSRQCTGGQDTPEGGPRDYSGTWVCHQYKEEPIPTVPETGVPWLHHQHPRHGDIAPSPAAPLPSNISEAHCSSGKGNDSSAGPAVGDDDSSSSSNPSGTPPLRNLERLKIQAARKDPTYNSVVRIPPEVESDLQWWVQRLQSHNGRPLQIPQWDLTVESDASLTGWGASCQGSGAGGPWTQEEQTHHINYLELKAAFLALKTFLPNMGPLAVLLCMDNITAIAFLNRMGGTHSLSLSALAVEIWEWCIQRRFTIHAEHLPGMENIRADWLSRHLKDSSDWTLNRNVFLELQHRLGQFSIDLFASRTNTQLQAYCSWKPDPGAVAIDTLSIPWTPHNSFMFPPFALIPRCLAKLLGEEASAVLIAPVWPNQTWFPRMLECLSDLPILLPPLLDIVTNPEGQPHPLATQGSFPLAAWPVSGDHTKQLAFQMELSQYSGSHGGIQLNQATRPPGAGGIAGVSKGQSIHFLLL